MGIVGNTDTMVWAKCSFLLLQEVVLIATARLERLKCTVQINLFWAYSNKSTLHSQTKSTLHTVMMAQRKPTPVAARSKAWVSRRSLAGIVGSNPAGGMHVCPL